MGRHQYQPGFRENFIRMMKNRHAPKCRMCNRPQRPNENFVRCPRCDWLLCPHCLGIHRPERHDWNEGDPTNLKNCEMCSVSTDDLAPCKVCLYMLCPRCRSRHKSMQHDFSGVVLLTRQHSMEISQRTLARVGNPPHGEPPGPGSQSQPDCPDCQNWYERFSKAWPEESKVYLAEQEKVWKARFKDIMDDLGISEEELGGPI